MHAKKLFEFDSFFSGYAIITLKWDFLVVLVTTELFVKSMICDIRFNVLE